jgi:hypothetical protein
MVAYAKSLVRVSPYRYDVYVANADGTSKQRLTYFADDGGRVDNIHWSLDGNIYFNAGSDRNKDGIYSVDKEGNLKYIMYGGSFLGISANGKSLLYDNSVGCSQAIHMAAI